MAASRGEVRQPLAGKSQNKGDQKLAEPKQIAERLARHAIVPAISAGGAAVLAFAAVDTQGIAHLLSLVGVFAGVVNVVWHSLMFLARLKAMN